MNHDKFTSLGIIISCILGGNYKHGATHRKFTYLRTYVLAYQHFFSIVLLIFFSWGEYRGAYEVKNNYSLVGNL